jgi:hypothetical protein
LFNSIGGYFNSIASGSDKRGHDYFCSSGLQLHLSGASLTAFSAAQMFFAV